MKIKTKIRIKYTLSISLIIFACVCVILKVQIQDNFVKFVTWVLSFIFGGYVFKKGADAYVKGKKAVVDREDKSSGIDSSLVGRAIKKEFDKRRTNKQ